MRMAAVWGWSGVATSGLLMVAFAAIALPADTKARPAGLAAGDLRCEYLRNPLGIDTPRPRLSWALASKERAQRQTAAQVLVASSQKLLDKDRGDLWDSGKVDGDQSVQVVYAGKAMTSRQRCFWKVRAWDKQGKVSPWSDTATWEMGLLDAKDWQAKWIGDGRPVPEEKPVLPAPYFRKSFRLTKQPKHGRAYICGLGFFELTVNGQKVSDDVLVPNQTDYDKREMRKTLYNFDAQGRHRCLYLTYDITPLLQKGENVVGVVLGNGWYNQRAHTVEGLLWYGPPRLICQVEVDGTVVASDTDWKWSTGPIVYDQIFTGEVYDARLEMPGWDKAGFDDAAWKPAVRVAAPDGRLRAQMSPPDQVLDTLRPNPPDITSINTERGEYVVKFGAQFAGWIRLRMRGAAGTRVVVELCERLNNGKPGLTPDQQPTSATYILKGNGDEVYEPRFTWFAGRYVKISGYPGKLSPGDIEGRFVCSQVKNAGSFRCSNFSFAAIDALFRRTQLCNLHGCVPSDCPHRERLGYTGDGQITSETALMTLDMAPFYTKWVADIAEAQDRGREPGYVPHTAPYEGGGGGPAWGSACVVVPWNLYLYRGDRRILEENYETMKLWMDYFGSWQKDGIVLMNRSNAWNLGEWLAPGDLPPPEIVHTYYYAHCAHLMSQIAGVLGHDADAKHFAEVNAKTQTAFHAKFLNREKKMFHNGKGGADAFGLAIGGLPKELADEIAAACAQRLMANNGGHLDTGFLGSAMLFDLLADHGQNETAFTLMNQRTEPSLGNMIENGATTIWESWNGGASHIHPAMGAGVKWMYQTLAGLRIDPSQPGYRRVIIKPQPCGDVTNAVYAIETPRGQFIVNWEKSDREMTIHVVIPANSTAVVSVPTTRPERVTEGKALAEKAEGVKLRGVEEGRVVYEVGSGDYAFRVAREK